MKNRCHMIQKFYDNVHSLNNKNKGEPHRRKQYRCFNEYHLRTSIQNVLPAKIKIKKNYNDNKLQYLWIFRTTLYK